VTVFGIIFGILLFCLGGPAVSQFKWKWTDEDSAKFGRDRDDNEKEEK